MSKGKVTLLIHINYSPFHFIINHLTFLRDINCDFHLSFVCFFKVSWRYFSLEWGTDQNKSLFTENFPSLHDRSWKLVWRVKAPHLNKCKWDLNPQWPRRFLQMNDSVFGLLTCQLQPSFGFTVSQSNVNNLTLCSFEGRNSQTAWGWVIKDFFFLELPLNNVPRTLVEFFTHNLHATILPHKGEMQSKSGLLDYNLSCYMLISK